MVSWTVSGVDGGLVASGTGTSTQPISFAQLGTYTATFTAQNATSPTGCNAAATVTASATQAVTPCTGLRVYSAAIPVPAGQTRTYFADSAPSVRWVIEPLDGGPVLASDAGSLAAATYTQPGTYRVRFIAPTGCGEVQQVITPACVGTAVLRDDFRIPALEPHWRADTTATASSVTLDGGRLLLRNRAHLATQRDFDPAVAPVRVTAEWTSLQNEDFLQVQTRSSGRPAASGPFGTTHAVQCLYFFESAGVGERLHIYVDGLPLPGVTRTGAPTNVVPAAFLAGDTVMAEMFDDGLQVTCRLRKKGSAVAATITGSTPFRPPMGGRSTVSFTNREQRPSVGGNYTAILDHVTIEQGVVQRPLQQWDFEDVVGTTVFGAGSDGGTNGTLSTATTPATGLVGASAQLVGNVNSYVSFGGQVANFGLSNFSVSWWFKTTSTASDFMELVGNRNSGSGGEFIGTRLVRTGPLVSAEVLDEANAAGTNAESRSARPLHDGQWHHVVLTHEGRESALYVDGVLGGAGLASQPPNIINTDPLFAGRISGFTGFGKEFVGEFDDIRIYPHMLSACEAQALGHFLTTPTVTLTPELKKLRLSWTASVGATHYQVFVNPGTGALSQVGADTQALAVDLPISVHQLNWSALRYAVRACNAEGCSTPAWVVPDSNAGMLQTIGQFKTTTTAAGEQLGATVALSDDARTLLTCAPFKASALDGGLPGALYVFGTVDGGWTQEAELPLVGSSSGGSTDFCVGGALSADGTVAAIGHRTQNPNNVLVYRRSGGVWTGPALVPAVPDTRAVALSGDGQTLAVGSGGQVRVFTFVGNTWVAAPGSPVLSPRMPRVGSWFGHGVALDFTGATLAVGDPDNLGSSSLKQGAVYVYERNTTGWMKVFDTDTATPFENNAGIGYSLALSSNGRTLVAGPADPFQRVGPRVYQLSGTWSQVAVLASATGTQARYGERLAISGDGNWIAASDFIPANVGFRGSSSGTAMGTAAGRVVLFQRTGTASFAERNSIAASNGAGPFGRGLGFNFDGSTLAVGAMLDGSANTTVSNGVTSNVGATNSGAVFLY